jgi:hypothetical protein
MAQDPTRPLSRGGRPREFDDVVSVRLPATVHDALSREAVRRGVDLSDVIRERLTRPSFVSQNHSPTESAGQ